MAGMDGQLSEVSIKSFLTLPSERLILAKRKHWFVAAQPIFIVVFLASSFFLFSILFFLFYFHSPLLFIESSLIISIITLSLITKILVDWYYHLYVVTTRRILEICYTPLFSDTIYDVLLDQVRTTEVDVRIKSFLHEFLNMGDVNIVFDRPSHEETFMLCDIKDPRKTGIFLCDSFETIMHEAPVWFEPRRQNNILRFSEDIFPDHPVVKI